METLQEKATRHDTKSHNTRLILQTIYNEHSISRADVARETKLTRPTVSEIVCRLIKEKHLVREIGEGQSSGGRIPMLLSIEKDSRHLIAVDLSSDILCGAVINLRGEITQSRNAPLAKQRSEKAILRQISQLIDRLKETTKETKLLGIGLSITGLVNPVTGILHRSTVLKIRQVHFKDRLEERFKLPVYVINDAQALALAEYNTLFQRKSITSLIVVKTGRGIGGGIVLNGQLYNADGKGAGEIGHLVVADAGETIKCDCGNSGCLTTVARDANIIRAWERASKEATLLLHDETSSGLDQIGKAAEGGDTVALQIVEETGCYLGRAIGHMVNILNIPHITVSGKIQTLGKTLLKAMYDEMRKYCLEDFAQNVTIDLIKEEPDKMLLGAASQVLLHELGIKRIVHES